MSLHDYQISFKISARGDPFYALLMALFRAADSDNLEKLKEAFPETYTEFVARYRAPGGVLPSDSWRRQ